MKTVLAVLMLATMAIGEEKPKAPPTPSAPPAAVQLSQEEKTRIELVRTKQTNLDLRIQLLNAQIQAERQDLAQQEQQIVAAAAKVHGVDLAKYRLDGPGMSFVPVPEAKPEKK